MDCLLFWPIINTTRCLNPLYFCRLTVLLINDLLNLVQLKLLSIFLELILFNGLTEKLIQSDFIYWRNLLFLCLLLLLRNLLLLILSRLLLIRSLVLLLGISICLSLIMRIQLLQVKIHGHTRLNCWSLLCLSSLLRLCPLNHNGLISMRTAYKYKYELMKLIRYLPEMNG